MRWGDIAYENAVKNPEIQIVGETPKEKPMPKAHPPTLTTKFETMWQELGAPQPGDWCR